MEENRKWEEKLHKMQKEMVVLIPKPTKTSVAQMAEKVECIQCTEESKHLIGSVEKQLQHWEDQVEEM